MITLKHRVFSALSGLCGDVIYGVPGDFTAPERIVWRESRNRRFAQADGREHLAELNYTLDIFARTPEAAAELFARADEKMAQAGFRRESAEEMFEKDTGVHHVSARYRALADAEGNTYQ